MQPAGAAAAAAAAAAVLLLLTCCIGSASGCPKEFFKCADNSTIPCVSRESVCDDKPDCLDGSDEVACSERRQCEMGEFRCSPRGNCIHSYRMCDGRQDCNNGADEEGCEAVSPTKSPALCSVGQMTCRAESGGQICLAANQVCDSMRDCPDGRDENSCPCTGFSCDFDQRCLKDSQRCDGWKDCNDGSDEIGCANITCQFGSDMRCPLSNDCTHHMTVCDGSVDCQHMDDEICPVELNKCKQYNYWTCASGDHCIMQAARCDGKSHCPDGSDEFNCTATPVSATTAPTPQTPPCKANEHLCNATHSMCVELPEACFRFKPCPFADRDLDRKCDRLWPSHDPCRHNNGDCQQVCKSSKWKKAAKCSCRPGYRVDADYERRCVDVNECERFGACSQQCINSAGSYFCSCASGYRLDASNKCVANTPMTLLFSSSSKIEALRSGQRRILVENQTRPTLLVGDASSGAVYFFTHSGQLVRKLPQQQQPEPLLVNPLIRGLALDWWRQLLLFTVMEQDGEMGSLMAMNLTSGRTVQLLELRCPSGLAAMPQFGLVFVSQLCGQTGIFRIRLDRTPLTAEPLAGTAISYGLPLHLAADSQQQPPRLYWSDSERRAIFSCDVSGNGTRKHWPPSANRQLGSVPSALAVFEDSLLWVDSRAGSLRRASKFVADVSEVVAKARGLRSVAVVHKVLQPKRRHSSLCACGHVCLGTAAAPLCFCDRQHELNNRTGECQLKATPPPPHVAANDAQLLDGRVGSVACVVSGALTALVLLAALLAAVCIRRAGGSGQADEQPLHFANDSFDYFGKAQNYMRLPKVASQATIDGSDSAAKH